MEKRARIALEPLFTKHAHGCRVCFDKSQVRCAYVMHAYMPDIAYMRVLACVPVRESVPAAAHVCGKDMAKML